MDFVPGYRCRQNPLSAWATLGSKIAQFAARNASACAGCSARKTRATPRVGRITLRKYIRAAAYATPQYEKPSKGVQSKCAFWRTTLGPGIGDLPDAALIQKPTFSRANLNCKGDPLVKAHTSNTSSSGGDPRRKYRPSQRAGSKPLLRDGQRVGQRRHDSRLPIAADRRSLHRRVRAVAEHGRSLWRHWCGLHDQAAHRV